jgi:hypothetical protein
MCRTFLHHGTRFRLAHSLRCEKYNSKWIMKLISGLSRMYWTTFLAFRRNASHPSLFVSAVARDQKFGTELVLYT